STQLINDPDRTPNSQSESSSVQSPGSNPFHDAAGSGLVPRVNYSPLIPPLPEPVDGSESDDADDIVLPRDWSATTNSKGRLYYYNPVTRDASWNLPPGTTITHISSRHRTAAVTSRPSFERNNDHVEVISQGESFDQQDEESLPEGWNTAYDDNGALYFFNVATGETSWDRPTSRSTGPFDDTIQRVDSPSPSESSLGKELHQLPAHLVQRKGALKVKSQLVSTNATISSWKDYWVVVFKGYLLFYRDDHGSIRHAYAQKSSSLSDPSSKQKHGAPPSSTMPPTVPALQAKPSGIFDIERVDVELPSKDQVMTKKKNVFFIHPSSSVRLLIQDASGGDERAWVKDIQASMASRKADEQSGVEEPYTMQVLRHRTSGSALGETSGLRMNKKIEEKEMKTMMKNPLKTDKARGIRNMVAHGIHVPRRKSGQDERLRLPDETTDPTLNSKRDQPPHYHRVETMPAQHSTPGPSPSPSSTSGAMMARPVPIPQRHSSREQAKDLSSPASTQTSSSRKDQDLESQSGSLIGNDSSGNYSSTSALQGAAFQTKSKLTNMSRSFFSKDKDREKDKDKEKEKSKEKSKDKSKDKQLKNKFKTESPTSTTSAGASSPLGSQVFGGYLTIEEGRTVPMVVELCIKTIEARGLSTPGIYRVSGHMSSIQNLKRVFNNITDGTDPATVEQLVDNEPDINTIAALLKLYFRELREPLIMFDFYPSFIVAAEIPDYNEKLYTIKSLVHALPEANFNTLNYLMKHLGRVQDQYATTKMDSANLAICFAPNLLRQEVDDLTSIINTGKQSSIIDTMIEQQEWIFDPYPDDDEEEEEEEAVGENEDGTATDVGRERTSEECREDHPIHLSQSTPALSTMTSASTTEHHWNPPHGHLTYGHHPHGHHPHGHHPHRGDGAGVHPYDLGPEGRLHHPGQQSSEQHQYNAHVQVDGSVSQPNLAQPPPPHQYQ
ncbi:hypothetical protein BGW38_003543, partial [Lunasporangiospora selenospora]